MASWATRSGAARSGAAGPPRCRREEPGAGGLRDLAPRLDHPALQEDDVGLGLRRRNGLEVPSLKLAVALDAVIDDGAVECCAHRKTARPALRRHGHGQSRDMPVLHADEAALFPARGAAAGIAKAQRAQQQPLAQVELLTVVQHLDVVGAEPSAVLDPQHEHQPVRDVDEVLVLDRPAGELGYQTIVAAGKVRAGIVDVVGHAVRRGGTRDEVAVAESAQRLAQLLLRGHIALVGQRPMRCVAATHMRPIPVRFTGHVQHFRPRPHAAIRGGAGRRPDRPGRDQRWCGDRRSAPRS